MKRKAQGAIEYLFMIAAALVIVLIVWRQLQGRSDKINQVANSAENNMISSLNQEISNTTTTTTTA